MTYSLWLRLSLAGVVLAVLMPSARAQEQAVFRAGVDLMTLDATVVSATGLPDGELRADDFVLKVDGKVRPVVSAQFVREGPKPDAGAASPPGHFSSNEFVEAGRLIVVAVDEAHVRRTEGRAALNAGADFVDQLHPLDRVAVLGLARGGPLEFSRDRIAARGRLNRLAGQGDPAFLRFNIGLTEAVEIADGGRARLADVVLRECGRALTEYLNPARAADETGGGRDACPEQVEQEARATAQFARTQARISLSALEGLIASLRELDRPSTVVLLSEGMLADPRLIDFAELAAAAQAARVTIYALHMDTPLFEAANDRMSPTFLRDVQIRGDGIARLAGAARGAVFQLVGGDPAPFRRIINELSGHYLVAFEPLPSERDGKVHAIELAVRRRGMTVRARHAFRLPAIAASQRAREADLVRLLRSATTVSELPVRVATYTYVEPATPDLRVVVSTETETAAAPSGVVLGYVLVDARGVVVSSAAHRTSSGQYAFTTRVPRGGYTLRVGAIDSLGRRGLVQRAFTAAVRQQQNIQVSDLILAPGPARPETTLQPIVDRLDAKTVVAYLELSAAGTRPLTNPEVRLSIVTEAGTATGLQTKADVTQSGGLWARARGEVALDTLSSGTYVVIAQVMSDGMEVGRVTRPFRVP